MNGLKETYLLSSIVGSSCVTDFMRTSLVLQVIFLTYYLIKISVYIILEALEIFHFFKTRSSRFYNSSLLTCVRKWNLNARRAWDF